jgi:O-antigen/teichoic acid export membrane protein
MAYWAFVVGMLVAFVLGITYYSRMHKQLADQKRENKKLLSELTSLRNVAIEETEE